MEKPRLTSKQMIVIFKLGSHPPCARAIEKHGFMEDNYDLSIGYNPMSGDIYIALENGLCVYTFEGRFQPDLMFHTYDDNGTEIDSLDALEAYVEANPEYVEDNKELFDTAREAFVDFEREAGSMKQLEAKKYSILEMSCFAESEAMRAADILNKLCRLGNTRKDGFDGLEAMKLEAFEALAQSASALAKLKEAK